MSDQSKLGIGKIITDEQHRDAIHVAVAPVVAGERLGKAWHVGLNAQGKASVLEKPIGIVDPFIQDSVEAGQTFWLFLYPGSITSLRHEWTHPTFSEQYKPGMSKSEEWIRSWASGFGFDYEEALMRADDYVRNGDYWVEGGRFEGEGVPDEFWTHYQNVTGKDVGDRGSFFSCSC